MRSSSRVVRIAGSLALCCRKLRVGSNFVPGTISWTSNHQSGNPLFLKGVGEWNPLDSSTSMGHGISVAISEDSEDIDALVEKIRNSMCSSV
jgi:hypothetical protein